MSDFSELAREKMWGRLYLTPLLQAEEDRDQVRRYYADKAREKELLGSEQKVYNSDRYVISMQILFRILMAQSIMLIALLGTASSALPSPTLLPRLPNRRCRLRIHRSRAANWFRSTAGHSTAFFMGTLGLEFRFVR